jgi:hypothetical protein
LSSKRSDEYETQNDNHNSDDEDTSYNSNLHQTEGFRISYGSKSLNICDPLVLNMVDKSKSERFRKYYSFMCSTNSVGDVVSGYSKNGKLKGAVDLYKFFGKRGMNTIFNFKLKNKLG